MRIGSGALTLDPARTPTQLVGRLARTYLSWWVRLHWILQAGLGGPVILITFALGVSVRPLLPLSTLAGSR